MRVWAACTLDGVKDWARDWGSIFPFSVVIFWDFGVEEGGFNREGMTLFI